MNNALFLCLSLAFINIKAGSVSYIKPCHYSDSKCITESAKNALPFVVEGDKTLGTPSLDPLELKNLTSDTNGLNMKFTQVTIKELKKCQIINVVRPDQLKLTIELDCPFVATGYYDFLGKLFVLDIEGHGAFEIKTTKIKLIVNANLKVIEKDGVKYYKIANFDYEIVPVDKVYFEFENLFNGDKDKAAPVIAVMDESWKEIITVMGKPVIEEAITQVVHVIVKLFLKVPAEELEISN